MHSNIERRKRDHLKYFRKGERGVPARKQTTLLECVKLMHQALPELDLDEIKLATQFAGREFQAPLFITGMTGGTSEAATINKSLARVAQEFGLGLGLGSQRAMLKHQDAELTYQVRDAAPDVFLAGNIGGMQLVTTPMEDILGLVERIEADALCVHLNPAQELAQPEGDRRFRGIRKAIKKLVAESPKPIIVKETGAGLSRAVVRSLKMEGVKSFDVSGAGGTSWVGVELLRREDEHKEALEALWDWGIPTAVAVMDVADEQVEVMASGGIRTGLDVAQAIALGADIVGLAAPVIQAYFTDGEDGVRKNLSGIIETLRRIMLVTGCSTIPKMKRAPKVILEPLVTWHEQRAKTA